MVALSEYRDDKGNRIEFEGPPVEASITFRGHNNTLVVDADARIGRLSIVFDCDNGEARIGGSSGVPAFSASIRVGQDSRVEIGRNVSTTSSCLISATEGTSVVIGDDVMIASENQIRADDGHPIFSVRTGRRVNVSRSISVGDHVWIGARAVLLGGTRIGDGSVIGFGSIVKGSIPNNCVAAGIPARVVRRDIAWERPHLSLVPPFYKPDASTVSRSEYWSYTEPVSWRRRMARRFPEPVKRWVKRVLSEGQPGA